ncbi:hypothetical protein [Streptococcus oriscaviae]|uniref:Uncharacterized protein n=1 Tax=Streptococcus oriscaviae TaxID=2781599 RepID=A0ABX7YIQ3_9STRE|nr:hypothetical protein [Streptococcus oriscaviae]QUE53565.1 hypothetical protein INT76_06790 [Streptococcus oriscaviae]
MKFFKEKKKGMLLGAKVDVFDQISFKQEDVKFLGETLEMAPAKKMLLNILDGRLKKLYKDRESFPERFKDELAIHIGVVKEEKMFVESLPDVLYTVERVNLNLLKINGLDGSCYELSLLKVIIGGWVYQLKDIGSDRVEEIVTTSNKNYLSIVEKCCVGDYLFPDSLLSVALKRMRENRNES